MKLLHVDASVLGPNSVSRRVSAAIVERLRAATPGLEITDRDLAADPLSHLSGEHLAAANGRFGADAGKGPVSHEVTKPRDERVLIVSLYLKHPHCQI